MSLADHIVVMNKGHLMQRGSAEDIYGQPTNKFVADFIGQSNWFKGRLEGENDLTPRRFITEDGLTILVVGGATPGAEELELGVRPERVVVRIADTSRSAGTNCIEGVIEATQYLGSTIHHWVRLPSGRRIHAIEQNNGQVFARDGEAVRMEFRPDDCLLVKSA
jgi:ABC-type Fe3+/spermidine/putrescine transport system ATPase subunit